MQSDLGNIQFKFMTVGSKFAAVALSVTLMVLPAAALVSCTLHGPGIREDGTACQMTHKHLAVASIQASLPGTACCGLTSGRPIPGSAVQTPSATADEVSPTSAVSSTDVPSTNRETASTEPLVRASGPTLQAVLCVFQI